MKLRFWGVRGSIPVPGTHTARYGGNTSCIEVSTGEDVLVFDMGTGARALGLHLLETGGLNARCKLHLFFTHLHVDHIFGFPFFGPIFAPSRSMTIRVPAFSVEEARNSLSRFLNGVNHPLRLREIPAKIEISCARPGEPITIGGITVTPVRLNHPGGSLGYRVDDGQHVVVYLSDTAPLARPGEGVVVGQESPAAERRVVEAMADADCVVMDTMFSWEEYLEKMTWGHAYPEYAVALARAARVKKLFLFHHAPSASDDELDRLAAKWSDHLEPRVVLAKEGLEVDLEE